MSVLVRRFWKSRFNAIRLGIFGMLVLVLPLACACGEEASAIEARLLESVRYLASDELDGRGVGTAGLDLAADYIAERFAQARLRTELYDGTPFQKFRMTTGAKLGTKNELALVGPAGGADAPAMRIELTVGVDFTPLSIGGSGAFDLPLVFAGYGITAKDKNYDDYAGIDVTGKAVIVLRHEPQQDHPHSAFDGTRDSRHAPFTRKVSNAYEHGAAAIIFVTDEAEIRKNVARRLARWNESIAELHKEHTQFLENASPSLEQVGSHRLKMTELVERVRERGERLDDELDPLLRFNAAGSESEGRKFPVLNGRRAAIDNVLRSALDTDLAALERTIDEGPMPHSRELSGWRAIGDVSVERTETEVKNVLGVLDGEGPLADETVVIGAHYDHLGHGDSGSLAPGGNEIHNGADDNASGTACLIELARILSARQPKLRRRVVFAAFTGEERGLVGSARYVREPLFPLEHTVAMLNMDMVGRLKDEKLIIYGTGTAAEFDPLIERINSAHDFQITKRPGGFGPSDHSSFYAKKVPVLHLFTGTHADYHRPSDDVEKVNVEGMRRITQWLAELTIELANADTAPSYQELGSQPALGGGGDRPYFGSVPDFAQEVEGYALSGVTKDGPAERAGLKSGDVIVQLGESRVGNLEDFDSALRKYKAGDRVPVVIQRGHEQLTLEVTLESPR